MADREEKPRTHVVEHARSGRSSCQTCGKPIDAGALRLSEAFVTDEGRWGKAHQHARSERPRSYNSDDDGRRYDTVNPDVVARFHHLECAAQHQPYKLRSALAATDLEIPDRAQLVEAIERGLSAVDVAEENPDTREDHARFIQDLRTRRDDEGMLVFADWLQSVNDPRGELGAIQCALETATDERMRLVELEKKLLAQHRKRFLPDRLEGKLVWRRGFVHRLIILAGGDATALARTFSHPSFRLLRELAVELENTWSTLVVAANLPSLPSTLRVLDFGGSDDRNDRLGTIAPVLAGAMPQLERLRLRGIADLTGLAHPSLAELELGGLDATEPELALPRGEGRTLVERLRGLDHDKLPGLRSLVLRVDRGLDAAVAALAGNPLLKHLNRLTLHGDLSRTGVTTLADAAGAHLDVLDLRGCGRLVGVDLEHVRPFADQILRTEPAADVETPVPKAKDWLVRHTRKPEWGIGRVLAENDQGLEVEFEHAGIKQVRNVELLAEVDA